MTGTGVAFIALGLLLSAAMSLRFRSAVYLGLFVVHLAAAFFMWQFTLVRLSDAWGYYNFSAPMSGLPVGTWAVGLVVSCLREVFEASYVDMYMILHLSGYMGIASMYHVCQEEFLQAGSPLRGRNALVHAAVFLPSLHVWTSVIGKDSIIIMTTMFCVWASLRPRQRIGSFLLGIFLSFIVRPHEGALLIVSCALAVIFDRHTPMAWKGLIVTMLALCLAVVTPIILKFVGLQSVDTDSLSLYMESRQTQFVGIGSGVDFSQYSFPMQLFTYLYRPLFFDAVGALGWVVSVENLFCLSVTLLFTVWIWRVFVLGDRSFFVTFNFIFWLLSTSIFAMNTSNLGVALRQKTAFLPSFFLVIFAAHAARETSRARSRATSPAVPLQPTRAVRPMLP